MGEDFMDRRSWLKGVPAAAAALSVPLGRQPSASPVPRPGESDFPLLPPGVSYFTRQKAEELVGTTVPIAGIPFEVIAYHFPSWHPSPYMEKLFGKGWTEFECVRHATPWFQGEIQPKRPLWGMFDPAVPGSFNEADPEWAAREIDLAASSGIDAFMIDWYWHMGTQFYHEQLEEGLLKAPNRQKIKFAVMWANHNWANLYPAPIKGKEAILNPQEYSEADMDRLTDYLFEHYLRQPNYLRIQDQPVFSIFNVDGEAGILHHFGAEKLSRVFDRMRNRAAKSGLKGLHVQASHVYTAGVTPLKSAGFDSATHYHTFGGGPPGKTTPYAEAMEKSLRTWKETAPKLDIPYFPDCPVGWNNSPRYGGNAHRVTNKTPDQYELQLLAAKYFIAARRTSPAWVFLSSWNEWTEDHCLLPDEVHGYGFLDAVRRQFASQPGA
jgi:hypothetical protein